MTVKYVKGETARLLDTKSGSAKMKCELLWGDHVQILEARSPRSNGLTAVSFFGVIRYAPRRDERS